MAQLEADAAIAWAARLSRLIRSARLGALDPDASRSPLNVAASPKCLGAAEAD